MIAGLVLAIGLAGAADGDALCRAGIVQAGQGRLAAAESLFTAMLSASRHDPCALNNLGNVELLRGHPGTALAYYARAQSFDSLDAGIHLNRALAFEEMGDEARGREEAAAALRLAGDPDSLGTLVGLRPEEGAVDIPERGASAKRLGRAQVRALLRAAVGTLSADSTRSTASSRRKEPPRRSAGPRAENAGDSEVHLYWKR